MSLPVKRFVFKRTLTLAARTVFPLRAQVEEGWWEGVLHGKTGMFPSNFTKEIQADPDAASLDTPTSQEEVRSRTSES